jgi:two-component system chemotaxis response regulator CheY
MARILIVDDTELMRKTLATILEREDHEVVGNAKNGVEAVELFKETNPDLITMDITMPIMNGLEAIKEIIRLDHQAKIVVCSAMGQQKIIVQAIEEGAKDFIVKPFLEVNVIETVNNVLN